MMTPAAPARPAATARLLFPLLAVLLILTWSSGFVGIRFAREQASVFLVLFATFACYGVYYVCLRLYSPARITSVISLSPPVTMLWASAMFGEPQTLVMLPSWLLPSSACGSPRMTTKPADLTWAHGVVIRQRHS